MLAIKDDDRFCSSCDWFDPTEKRCKKDDSCSMYDMFNELRDMYFNIEAGIEGGIL